MEKMGNFSHIDAVFSHFYPISIRCTHLLQRCALVVLPVVPFLDSPFFRVVLGTPWCCSIIGRAMDVPLFKAHNGSTFVKKNHCDHLNWVSACQSSKKLGKKTKMGRAKCMMRRTLELYYLRVCVVCKPSPFLTVLQFFQYVLCFLACSGGRAPKYLKEEDVLPIIVLGKREEAAAFFFFC